jgi:hypothetical protein
MTAPRALLLTAFATLILAAPAAAAHPGGGRAAAGPTIATLRDCLLTVAYAPRPAAALQDAIPGLPDPLQTFYGSDPLLGIWALRCDGAKVSVVAVPVGVAVDGAPPLANFLSHALLRVDTNSPKLARRLRRAGLPARVARRPGYGVAVTATVLDPTNPHDHRNTFSRLGLVTDDAHDRFCFPAAGGCTARLRARAGSPVARVLGAPAVRARVGFDHERLGRVRLTHLPAVGGRA